MGEEAVLKSKIFELHGQLLTSNISLLQKESTVEPRRLRSANNREVQKLVSKSQKLDSDAEAYNTISLDLSKLNDSEHLEEREKSSPINNPTAQSSPEKLQIKNGIETQEDATVLCKKKKKVSASETDLPRRTSKRLAGIDVEQPSIIEPHTRLCQAAVKPTAESITNHSVEHAKRVKTGNDDCKVEGLDNLSLGEAVLPEVQTKDGVTVNVLIEDSLKAVACVFSEKHAMQKVVNTLPKEQVEQEFADVLPEAKQGIDVLPKERAWQKTGDVLADGKQGVDILPNEQAGPEIGHVPPDLHSKNGVTQGEGCDKREMAIGSDLQRLWNDPCIEFAIKTLTGDAPLGNDEKVVAAKSGPSVESLDASPGSSQDFPIADIWSDPCFEFAVKTLTSDIPTIDAAHFRTVKFQQQHLPSKAGEVNGLNLPNYGAAQFNRAKSSYRLF